MCRPIAVFGFLFRAVGHPKREFLVPGNGLERAWLIDQHEGVLPIGVVKEPADPLFLKQAGEEGEVRLAVLNAVLPLGVAGREAAGRSLSLAPEAVRHIPFVEHLLHNFRNAQVLKNS